MTYLDRILADSTDRPAWLAARTGRCGASTAAKLAKLESAPLYVKGMLYDGFAGNTATDHGANAEQRILATQNMPHNTLLFHAEYNTRHTATPDGIRVDDDGLTLAEVKTTAKPLPKIPPGYMRQMQWQMYVMDAERCLFIWEEHNNFIPVNFTPETVLVTRNDTKILQLINIANRVLDLYDHARAYQKELTNV